MASYNKVILMGNLTRDPQLSYLPSQTPVVEIGLATNRRWRDQQGQQREDVCFVDCRCYGRQAEIINQYMKKGRPLLIEGRLELDQWEAQDGSKRSKHRVFIERFSFVDSGNAQGGGGGGGGNYGGSQGQASYGGPQSAPNNNAPQGGQQGPDQGPPNYYDDGGNCRKRHDCRLASMSRRNDTTQRPAPRQDRQPEGLLNRTIIRG
jgi:single-strand DNA-binding protein